MIIPCYNEAEAIGAVIREIPPEAVRDIIVVNNGSTDDSAAVARAAGATVVDEPRRGYGRACLAGIAALADDIEVVVFLDGDHSDFPEEMTELIGPVRDRRADLTIGSRVLGQREPGALLPQAYYGNKLAAFLIWLFTGHRITDLGPFRAIGREALASLAMADTNFGWTVEMQLKAIRMGLRVREVPVRYRKRIGKSKISGTLSGTVRAGTKIIYTIICYAFTSIRSAEGR